MADYNLAEHVLRDPGNGIQMWTEDDVMDLQLAITLCFYGAQTRTK